MRDLAAYFGASKIARSRDSAARVIANLYMQGYVTPAGEEKTSKHLDAEISEILAKKRR